MPWLDRQKDWLGRHNESARPGQRAYSVTRAAELLGVSRQTIYKYLSIDEPEYAIIPPDAWFRLPSGYIRIREWILIKLKNGEL